MTARLYPALCWEHSRFPALMEYARRLLHSHTIIVDLAVFTGPVGVGPTEAPSLIVFAILGGKTCFLIVSLV